MIMAAKALLDVNPDPDEGAIKKALARNLCRCTGYKKIIEAVRLSGGFLRKETTPDAERAKLGKEALGVSHVRPTALLKACGLALFNDDVPLLPDAVELAVVRSTEPHAVIKGVDTSEAEKMPGGGTYEALVKAGKPTRYEGAHKNEGSAGLDKATGQGNSQVSECHNIQMAEVEVNTETGETRVLKMTVCVDAGTIINPQAFEGQLEGGMDQGVGYALREEYVIGKTTDYVSFKFPTIRDSFKVEIITL